MYSAGNRIAILTSDLAVSCNSYCFICTSLTLRIRYVEARHYLAIGHSFVKWNWHIVWEMAVAEECMLGYCIACADRGCDRDRVVAIVVAVLEQSLYRKNRKYV